MSEKTRQLSDLVADAATVGVNPVVPREEDREDKIDGRTNLGRSIMTHVKRMSHLTLGELDDVAQDHASPIHARLAAQWLQRCMSTQQTSSGHFVASGELQHLLDRTLGKPAANFNVQQESKSLHLIAMTDDALGALDALG